MAELEKRVAWLEWALDNPREAKKQRTKDTLDRIAKLPPDLIRKIALLWRRHWVRPFREWKPLKWCHCVIPRWYKIPYGRSLEFQPHEAGYQLICANCCRDPECTKVAYWSEHCGAWHPEDVWKVEYREKKRAVMDRYPGLEQMPQCHPQNKEKL